MLFHRCKHNTVKFEMKIPVNTYTVVCKKIKTFFWWNNCDKSGKQGDTIIIFE